MTADEYLQAVLEDQNLEEDGAELRELRRHRERVERILRDEYGSDPTIRYGGSVAKGTLIRESYDLDNPVYFPHDDNSAGDTLEEIYEAVAETLATEYSVRRKRSALRLRDLEDRRGDLRVDVVPGRFLDDSETDAFLHQNEGSKERLKTNLQTHIDHIRESGVIDAIRLVKLWNVRRHLGVKTFVLELLVVKILDGRQDDALSEQLLHVLTTFRDEGDSLSIVDPANAGNDLSHFLDNVRTALASAASTSIDQIEEFGWPAVFGEVDEEKQEQKAQAVAAAVHSVSSPHRPWRADGGVV